MAWPFFFKKENTMDIQSVLNEVFQSILPSIDGLVMDLKTAMIGLLALIFIVFAIGHILQVFKYNDGHEETKEDSVLNTNHDRERESR